VVQNVVQQLKENGSVTRGWIGVQIQNVTPDLADDLGLKDEKGALVATAQRNSPAAAAGVKSGDVITEVDGETVADPHDLARRIAALGPKKTVKLTLVRNGSPMTVEVTLGTMPADKTASMETRGAEDNAGSALAKLGLTLRAGHGQDGGVVVAEVDPEGAAADKGLKQGDVILEVAGKPVDRPSQVADAIAAAKSGGKKSVLVRVKSNDGERYLTLPARAS
jgi:serine protease Do